MATVPVVAAYLIARRSRHAVLQAGPRRSPQRLRAHRHSLVQRADSSPEGEDLLSRDLESRFHRTRHELKEPRSVLAGSRAPVFRNVT